MPHQKTTVHLNSRDGALNEELADAVKASNVGIVSYIRPQRGVPGLGEIIVALGSAGAFTGLYQIVYKILERRKDTELIVEHRGTKVSLKGHSLPEEKELLEQLGIGIFEKRKTRKP